MKRLEWFGCYADSWQGEIVPEAFSHPAKFSRGLIARIYDHMLANGYIEPGDTVGDPFGGVALGAIHAMLKGLHWRGVELEAKFVDLGGQNIDLWQARYGELLRGTAVLVQGDSRQFLQHVAGLGGVISSSPYADQPTKNGGALTRWPGARRIGASQNENDGYGSTPGQLGSMPEGDLSAVVSSPAYADVINGSGEGPGARFDHIHHNGDNATKKTSAAAYGRTAGNLGNLAAVVSSAPFEKSIANMKQSSGFDFSIMANNRSNKWGRSGNEQDLKNQARLDKNRLMGRDYGDHPANIGNDTGSTFWQAAAVIVAQAYAALRPGAYAAWVTGNYRRDGQVVDFGGQWFALCKSVGFVGIERITAWKVERRGTQLDIFGNEHSRDISRVSFFRRLDNARNPGGEIESEEVWIVQKPDNNV